jgi:tetratricopeptide (TPR) repeat protein
MSYNKSKHLNAAQKYLQQGKLPQAIAEYQQILKNEPKDQVTLMTLGDLFVRQGETFQALEYFERLAKIFLNDGFTTKAIAIYKKVAKLAPEEGRPLERLAELYVQQGVLSEARPIFLQLAEMHLKAGRQPQAATLLRKLLEAEPDNLRVQTRLAELLLSMGQQKDAVETFHGALQKILDRGEHAEAIRLADRILQLDSTHQPSLLAKVRALSAAGKAGDAAKLLETLPNQDEGGETTSILLAQYLESGHAVKAAALAEKVYARDPKNHAIVHRVANAVLDSGDLDRAQALLSLIRDAMIDSGEHEPLAQSISRLAERRPGQLEPLEWLVDLYGRVSDSFRLPDALAQLAYAYEHAGNDAQALVTYEKLLERTPEDETARRKYLQLRSKAGLEPKSASIPLPVKVAPAEIQAKPAAPASSESSLDEETQRYVTQALTDVDLFSSYGLAQKAMDLLESVLERAPRHAPVLERLLDLAVGCGNDARTVELAAILEEIALEGDDRATAERHAEFRRRFQRSDTPAAPEGRTTAAPAATGPAEFAVPMIQAKLDEPIAEAPPPVPLPGQPPTAPVPVEAAVHEVDLSDEWAALSEQLESTMKEDAASTVEEPAEEPSVPESAPVLTPAVAARAKAEAEEAPAFDLELQPAPPVEVAAGDTMSADALVADLAADLESLTASLGLPAEPEPAVAQNSAPSPAPPPRPASPPSASSASGNGSAASAPPAASAAPSGPLGDLFEEFRSELGEAGKDDEDLETHYNLGIAYREMGLLEEAISEFQKVANVGDRGPAFRYAMQCSTLLGLAFMEKGQPAIAAIWYERALKTPGLDQETTLALRYDLGVAQELAGDAKAAFNSFSQVYAMNIDYRDVSERIALLGKAR